MLRQAQRKRPRSSVDRVLASGAKSLSSSLSGGTDKKDTLYSKNTACLFFAYTNFSVTTQPILPQVQKRSKLVSQDVTTALEMLKIIHKPAGG